MSPHLIYSCFSIFGGIYCRWSVLLWLNFRNYILLQLHFYTLEPVFNLNFLKKIRAQSNNLLHLFSFSLSFINFFFFSFLFSGIKQQDQNQIFSHWHSNISQAANCQTILCHFSKFLCFYLFMFCNYAFCWTLYSKLIFPLGTIKSWSWALLVIPWVLHSWS